MSLYNMIYGFQPAVYYVLPMISPYQEFPRFRDCFLGRMTRDFADIDEAGSPARDCTKETVITVFTRTGGANRAEYADEIEAMRAHPQYVEDYDDAFDNTFMCIIFSIPDKWRADFDQLVDPYSQGQENWKRTSAEYRQLIEDAYPKLKDKLPWNVSAETLQRLRDEDDAVEAERTEKDEHLDKVFAQVAEILESERGQL